ncbi:MAG: outer membrane lipoprotein carrier protein LolA [Bacteroidales bacterium]|nr:outer membrane lipoprotein carrier protein LolA [Candidatus Cryptobacteroides caccocaballi]
MMMKLSIRPLLVGIALLPGLLAGAQQKNALTTFTEKVATNKASFSYKFSAGAHMNGSGSAAVQGDCFTLKLSSFEMTCNGSTMWTVDRDSKEVIIEPVDSPEAAGAFNPALLIGSIGQAFNIKSEAQTNVNGKPAIRYTLVPKVSSIDIRELVVTIASDASAMYSMKATVKDGTVTDITIPNFSFGPKASAAEFTIKDSSFGRDYIITDLR